MSDISDLEVIHAARNYEKTDCIVNFASSMLTALIDWHGQLVAVGFPDRQHLLVVERRDDFHDVVHSINRSIASHDMKKRLGVIANSNMKRVWCSETTLADFLRQPLP